MKIKTNKKCFLQLLLLIEYFNEDIKVSYQKFKFQNIKLDKFHNF
jgi:hypothetical protein